MADTFELSGSARRVDLGRGFGLVAPGMTGRGTVTRPDPRSPSSRGTGGVPDALADALAQADMAEVLSVELEAAPQRGAPHLRTRSGDGAMELEAPTPNPGFEQVVLMQDEAGALQWIVAEPAASTPTAANVRGGAGTRRYLLPHDVASVPHEGGDHRSVTGWVARKILKVIVYPVADAVFGPVGEFFARRWEAAKRPYGLRLFTADDFAAAPGTPVRDAEWTHLRGGRALLFVHGTFSTAHGGFGGLPRETMGALLHRYGNRVFAVNTHTLSHDPARNAEWIRKNLPAGADLDVDIVCHSRGGLVTRELARSAPGSGLSVNRVVYVGVPNAGTALADADHMVHMLDRWTTVLSLFPTNGVTDALEAILTGVKVVGHGVLNGLDGLQAMNPEGEYLRGLGEGAAHDPARSYAVAADYDPKGGPLHRLVLKKAADSFLDRVFSQQGNDLVVPTAGVAEAAGGGFPVPPGNRHVFARGAGIVHTTYFGAPETSEALLRWLPG